MAAVRHFALWLLVAGSCCLCQQEQAPTPGSFLVSSIDHPRITLAPYDWTYIRVELPAWFSSLIMRFTSNVHSDAETIRRHPKSMPIMCFRQGGLPLPDVSDASLKYLSLNFTYDGYLERTQGLQGADWCLPFQKNMTLTLTNEQMSPGVWYTGFFNGLGPERTQSKMIERGPTYVFSILLTIEGCRSSTIWGPYCNQTMNPLSCGQPGPYKHSRSLSEVMYDSAGSMNSPLNVHYHSLHKSHFAGIKRISLLSDKKKESSGMDHTMAYNRLILCNNSLEAACIGLEDVNFYSLDILDPSSRFEIVAENIKLTNMTSINSTEDSVNTLLMCYVRYNAMPLKTFYDFSADISRNSLVIQLPQIGRWYIAIRVVNNTELKRGTQNALAGANLCFSLHWEVHTCPFGKAGLNCAANLHFLQRIYREDPDFPIRSYYLPVGESTESAMLLLEPLLSNSSIDGTSDGAWTYLILDIPRGAAGANLHVQLVAERRVEYEVYAKYGGLPSTVSWNYHVNSTSNSNSSMMLMSSDGEETIDFYILYVREGPWVIGLKHASNSQHKLHTMISISLEACPKHCSSYGSCRSSFDETGLSSYSFCYCDRVHGGFDCGNELISHRGHVLQSIFLIASNAAALFPAFWSLHQKAFAEWVLFTASGISSGLYHACDVGTWCALSFHVLQFMDFWLSFMAVVSTFVFMATINDASKRAIHTCVTIITALLAITGATRSANIILVIAIGTLGLVIAWVLEFSSVNRTNIFLLQGCSLNINERWQTSRIWLHGVVQRLRKRFHWHFLLIAFILLSAAGISWKLESNKSYWIWHSLWHITIYTSSFFFLCSVRSSSRQYDGTVEHELTPRNSPRLQ